MVLPSLSQCPIGILKRFSKAIDSSDRRDFVFDVFGIVKASYTSLFYFHLLLKKLGYRDFEGTFSCSCSHIRIPYNLYTNLVKPGICRRRTALLIYYIIDITNIYYLESCVRRVHDSDEFNNLNDSWQTRPYSGISGDFNTIHVNLNPSPILHPSLLLPSRNVVKCRYLLLH